ncbi:hypothetical protein BC827DRAFT_1153875 [Russula dissimulans]|nr:hypothetical protein BC827DRAFT_1153875 [Russula dissimulans]
MQIRSGERRLVSDFHLPRFRAAWRSQLVAMTLRLIAAASVPLPTLLSSQAPSELDVPVARLQGAQSVQQSLWVVVNRTGTVFANMEAPVTSESERSRTAPSASYRQQAPVLANLEYGYKCRNAREKSAVRTPNLKFEYRLSGHSSGGYWGARLSFFVMGPGHKLKITALSLQSTSKRTKAKRDELPRRLVNNTRDVENTRTYLGI